METRARALQRRTALSGLPGRKHRRIEGAAGGRSAPIGAQSKWRPAKRQRRSTIFLVARYGDLILMKPPLQTDTCLLWLAPFCGASAAAVVALVVRARNPARARITNSADYYVIILNLDDRKP